MSPILGRLRLPSLLALLVLAAVLAAAAGCTGSAADLRPNPLPAGIDVTGKWDSNWGRLVLTQTGPKLSGTSDYNDGRLEGTVDGDLILFDWVQPGNPSEARQEAFGKGWFRISQDGLRLEGKWGYGPEREGGGAWLAERVQ